MTQGPTFDHSGLINWKTFAIALCALLSALENTTATSNHEYQPGEYVTIENGKSPDGGYAIAAHGEGDLGYDNFHIYLMDGKTGHKIGPLEEITDTLDTDAAAFTARWSSDSKEVTIRYRVDRHDMVTIRYRIGNHRATRLSGPEKEQ